MQADLSDFSLFHMSNKDNIQQQATQGSLWMVSQAEDTTSFNDKSTEDTKSYNDKSTEDTTS